MAFALLLTIYVKPGMLLELALLATKAITLKRENVYIAIAPTNHKIQAVKPGTGTNKFVTNVQINGTIKKEAGAFLETHYVKLLMIMEPAQPATKDMI